MTREGGGRAAGTPGEADLAALPYRPCVGLVILNRAGEIFVGQRADFRSDAWQMPQGGVDEGEAPLTAALRELREETGITRDKVTLLAESRDWIPYDLPPHLIPKLWNGRYRGQAQRWFAFRFLGRDEDIDIDTEHREFSEWQWLPRDQVLDRIVPFKRSTYRKVLAEFDHLFR
ncbi:MAG: RNA pyrophosphohydrolase [Pseudomonadota bacterium]